MYYLQIMVTADEAAWSFKVSVYQFSWNENWCSMSNLLWWASWSIFCYNKRIWQPGGLYVIEIYFSCFWILESWDQDDSMVGWRPSSGCRLLIVSSHGGSGKGTFWSLSYEETNPFMRAPTSWPCHLPKACLLIPSPWALGFQHQFCGDTFRPQ